MKKEYWIHVKYVYNRLVIYLNGNSIWDSGILPTDTKLDEFINITAQLAAHPEHATELIFEGYNDSFKGDETLQPWHFQYNIIEREVNEHGRTVAEKDFILPYDEKHISNPNVQAINNCYVFVKQDSGFKVQSNSLTQNFAV